MAHNVVQYPVATEKAIRLMQNENVLTFVVLANATKPQIKEDVETLYGVKVLSVRTLHDSSAKKKAFVKLHSDYLAMDVATKLGIL